MFKRLGIYIREMFPLQVYLPFAILNHYILFFTAQVYLVDKTPVLSFYSLIGVATILGFMLIMRIFDEFKDTEVDAVLFASRPFPRGAVLRKDLQLLLFFTLFTVIILNSFRSYTLPFFIASFLYSLLTFKWFFMRQIISKNLMLALVTHQPITWLINVYVASTAMVQSGNFLWTGGIFLLTITFFIPVVGWELSRKIKAKGTENDYITYSKIFGPRLAAIITLLVNLSFSFLIIFISSKLNLSDWNYYLQIGIMGWIASVYMKFVINPTKENNNLKKAAEFHSALAILVYIIFFIIKYGIEFKWYIE